MSSLCALISTLHIPSLPRGARLYPHCKNNSLLLSGMGSMLPWFSVDDHLSDDITLNVSALGILFIAWAEAAVG